MKRMIAPGMPPWPKLLYDPIKRRAVIRARFATWRSYHQGLCWTQVISVAYMFLIFIPCWFCVPHSLAGHWKIGLTILLWLVIGVPSTKWMRYAMPGVLARQFFAVALKLWVTQDAIAFQSQLYARGIVLPRSWRGTPLRQDFTIDTDPCAVFRMSTHSSQDRSHVGYLENARHVILVTKSGADDVLLPGGEVVMNAIPVCSALGTDAERIAIVTKAALTLTEKQIDEPISSFQPGVDIDG